MVELARPFLASVLETSVTDRHYMTRYYYYLIQIFSLFSQTTDSSTNNSPLSSPKSSIRTSSNTVFQQKLGGYVWWISSRTSSAVNPSQSQLGRQFISHTESIIWWYQLLFHNRRHFKNTFLIQSKDRPFNILITNLSLINMVLTIQLNKGIGKHYCRSNDKLKKWQLVMCS